jgi:hypothetical protein
MTWVLISALGFAAWVSVMLWLVAVCRTAARGDEIAIALGADLSGSCSQATSAALEP